MDSATIITSDLAEILKHIPHRYPFLLIDRMLGCEPNRWVKVIKNVSGNDWFFQGIPIDQRVMPQMLVIEALAQSAGVLCHYSGMTSRIGKTIFFFAGFDNCRFGRQAIPGDQLLLECTMKRSMRGVAKLSGRASTNGDMVAETNLTAVLRDMEGAIASDPNDRRAPA